MSQFLTACNPLATKTSIDGSFMPGSSSSTVVVVAAATAPVVITTPSNNGYINASEDSLAYMVVGLCNVNGNTVQIKVDGVTLASPTCNGVTFNATIDSTALTQAAHTITATMNDTSGVPYIATNTFTRDVTAPAAATAIGWAQSSPSNTTTAVWTKSVAGDLGSQKIQFYSDGTCTTATGSLIDLGSATLQSYAFSGTSAVTYTHKVTSVDLAGNTTLSGCSSAMLVDTTAPSVSFTAPLGGSYVKGGATKAVTWTASDANIGATPIAIQVSSDGGSTYSALAGPLANSGSYNWAVPAVNSSTYRLRIIATDNAGNSTTVSSSSNFTIDSDAPVITAASFVINSGSITTNNNNVSVAIQATDAFTTISHLCLKSSLAAVTETDPCWVGMAVVQSGYVASGSINVTAYNYNIGIPGGAYDIYAYVKDVAGNFSVLTNAGAGTLNTDKYSLTYTQGQAAVLTNINSTNSNVSTYPPADADLNITPGQDVYIKWNATDDFAIPAGSISIYYTTDDTNYTLVASGLNNGVNNGAAAETCTVGGSYTGCFVWSDTHAPAPLTTYMKIRIQITDSNGFITKSSALPNNVSGVFKFIAGNTDSGLGGSAKVAAIKTALVGGEAAQHSMAVTSTGIVYFVDRIDNVLLKINPVDGTITKIASITGVTSGDGGPLTSATFYTIYKITVDHNDRLYILDGDRIRRYDPLSNVISLFIGGGGSKAEGTAALSFQITDTGSVSPNGNPFTALPNGDFIFNADSYTGSVQAGYKLRRYKASDGKVYSINFTGTGNSNSAVCDMTAGSVYTMGVGFNSSTSDLNAIHWGVYGGTGGCATGGTAHMDMTPVSTSPETYTVNTTPGYHVNAVNTSSYLAQRVTGMDGKMYAYGKRYGAILRYEPGTNTWTHLAGNYAPGQCADNTTATACPIDPYIVFVNAQGRVHFLDRNRIRVIDDAGKVQTLYGQSFAYGDGSLAITARMNNVKKIAKRSDNGNYIMLDVNEVRFREFAIDSNINTIAGNGASAPITLGVNATTVAVEVVDFNGDFDIDPSNGNVFYITSVEWLRKLNRATGFWEAFVGNGAGTPYEGADGMTGVNTRLSAATPNPSYRDTRVLGFNTTTNQVLAHITKYNSAGGATPWNTSMLKLYSRTDGTQAHLAGTTANCPGATSNDPTICADGTTTASCVLPTNGPGDFIFPGKYIAARGRWYFKDYYSKVKAFTPGGTTATVTDLSSAVNAEVDYNGTDYVVYYCTHTGGGIYKIRKRVVTTAGATVSDALLTWPVPAMSCTGRNMIYEPGGTPKLTFIYTLNGLQGVAQYINP